MRTLRRVPTFFRLEAVALAQVCALVRRVTYLAEETIATQGDVMTEMYFLDEGAVLHSRVPDDPEPGSDSESADGERTTVPARGVSVTGVELPSERVTRLLQHRGTPMCEVRRLQSSGRHTPRSRFCGRRDGVGTRSAASSPLRSVRVVCPRPLGRLACR